MKITGLTVYPVQPRWLFLKVETDEGITGWGEPSLEGQARAVIGALKDMEERVIGADPTKIERLWQILYRGAFYRGGPVTMSAISGIEHACWDILGKSLGVPVHALLGGAVRDRIRMYCWVGGDTTEALIESARAAMARGYTAVKTTPVGPTDLIDGADVVNQAAERMGALRAAVGDGLDIGLDMHGRLSPAMSIQVIDALKEMRPFFVEEPVLPESVGGLVRVARAVTTPIATGERVFTKWGFRDIIEQEAAAIVQPDLCHCGGIWEGRKIAAHAETRFIALAPHNPLGPISTAACLQLDAATPNFLVQEHATQGLGDDGHLREPFVLGADGTLPVGQKPGLGIEVDEEYVKAHPFESWINPLYDAPDGFITEW
jgi:galactonate dehydratase